LVKQPQFRLIMLRLLHHFDVFNANHTIGMHTLFLLDLHPKEDKFMTVPEAISFLVSKGVDASLLGVACCALGSEKQVIVAGSLKELQGKTFDVFPQCLIIPGKLHFMEEEFLEQFK